MKSRPEVWIVAAAAHTALGHTALDHNRGRGQLWPRLLAGNSGTADIRHFSTKAYYCHRAALIDKNGPGDNDGPRLEKMLAPLVQNLECRLPPDCELIGACLKGDIEAREELWRQAQTARAAEKTNPLANATDEGLLLQPANFLAQHFSLPAPGLNVGAACASSSAALALAAGRIIRGQSSSALVWGAEIITEFVFAGFAALKALSPDICRPFDRQRDGLLLGEGAALLLLMSAAKARQTGLSPLARLSGWGLANDAVHLTAPDREGRGLTRACRRALNQAGLEASNIAAIKAHGTGTIHNDTMEIAAFKNIFGASIPPLFSIKGALGHCLGAAGAIETVIALQSLKEKHLPPTVGLRSAEPAITDRVAAQPREFSGRNLLLTNSGFGGINCALILEVPTINHFR